MTEVNPRNPDGEKDVYPQDDADLPVEADKVKALEEIKKKIDESGNIDVDEVRKKINEDISDPEQQTHSE